MTRHHDHRMTAATTSVVEPARTRGDRTWRPDDGDELGAAAALFIMFVAVVAMLLLALVVDGGGAMTARRDVSVVADQAARVAADQLDLDSVRTGGSDLNSARAVAAAEEYLARRGARGTVSIDGEIATVRVRDTYQTVLLSMVGAERLPVTGVARTRSIGDGQVEELNP